MRSVAILLLVLGFLAAKVYVVMRPAGWLAMLLGGFLFMASTPAQAQ